MLVDFYSECDHHLNAVRQSLISLEQAPTVDASSAVLEKLFRSYHSLKGIIAMVGIGSAEQVAHRTEDYLREIVGRRAPLTLEGIDLLAQATAMIEQTVAAFRDHREFPDVTAVLDDIQSVLPKTETPTDAPEPISATTKPATLEEKAASAVAAGKQVWKCTFAPTPALNEQGINVNTIRESLVKSGEIIHAAPQVSRGSMTFTFLLATEGEPAIRAELQSKGISFELVGIPTPAAKASTGRPAAAETAQFIAPSQIVRVGLNRLDELMRVAGELVIQRARLEEQINRLASVPGVDVRGLQEVNLGFGRHFRELRETVMRLRMVPIAELFDRLPFVVRDLTRGGDKKVRLAIKGQQTELDKYVVEQLKDPLLHLVRNAISHGIETTAEREAAGKPAEATLSLTARAVGEAVVIEIADDGRGIDRQKVLARATQMGVTMADQGGDAAILDLICLPGFSTRDEADRAAGRGVGMDVVNKTVVELGGTISLHTEEGKGTHFTLRLPLTLLITEALIINSGTQQFAIPQSSVEEVLQIDEANIKRMERAELVSVRGSALPLVRLTNVFGLPKSNRVMPSVVVSQTDRGRVGLVVDRIAGQRQVVVRSLRDPLIHVPGVIGATELGDGRPILILDPLVLTKQGNRSRTDIENLAAKK